MLTAYKLDVLSSLGQVPIPPEAEVADYICAARVCTGRSDATTLLYKALQTRMNDCARILGKATVAEDGKIGPETANLAILLANVMSADFLAAKGLTWLAVLNPSVDGDVDTAIATLADMPAHYARIFEDYTIVASQQTAAQAAATTKTRRHMVAYILSAVLAVAGGLAGYYLYRRSRTLVARA